MADALLWVTRRKANAPTACSEKAYEKLRPLAKGQSEPAAPRLGQLLESTPRKRAKSGGGLAAGRACVLAKPGFLLCFVQPPCGFRPAKRVSAIPDRMT